MKNLIIPILLLISIIGCEKENNDSDIIVDMREWLDSTDRTFTFLLQTVEQYPCSNYSISRDVEISDEIIIIDIKDVNVSDVCLASTGPAMTQVSIKNIKNNEYDIEFKKGRKSTKGKLIVTNESFNLQIDNNKYFNFKNTSLYRVPENTIWGEIRYFNIKHESVVNYIMDNFQNNGAKSINLNDSDYLYFEIEDGKIKEQENSTNNYYKSFIYNYDGDENYIKKLVGDIGKQYEDSIYFSVYDDLGFEYYSWILKEE